MHPSLFRLLDPPARWLMSFKVVDRAMGFLTYQRKRTMRRGIEARLREQGLYGDEVVRGPFKGLKFPVGKYASARFGKNIGANEHELYPLIERLIATKHYNEIINVGAAEGFYSVGLARVFSKERVICYEAMAMRCSSSR